MAIIGAGGIGFDVAEFLTHEGTSPSQDLEAFLKEWGVDRSYTQRGALGEAAPEPPAREVFLLQRSKGKLGARLGKTTGWIHRSSLKMKRVKMMGSVQYQRIDDEGLHLLVAGKPQTLEVDHVIICAGQEPRRDLFEPLQNAGVSVYLIGGSDEAKELDAKRAIDQGTRLAIKL